MITPITSPFVVRMKMERTPNVAPPRKIRMFVTRLFRKILIKRATGSSPGPLSTKSLKRATTCGPAEGRATMTATPATHEITKIAVVTTSAGRSLLSDIQHHPHHIADSRGKAHDYHGKDYQVPEPGRPLVPVPLQYIDRREEDEELEGNMENAVPVIAMRFPPTTCCSM